MGAVVSLPPGNAMSSLVPRRIPFAFCALPLISFLAWPADPSWKPVPGHIMTKWAAQVTPDKAWPEYPRPQLVREQWQNLNGLWDYAITAKDASAPAAFSGRILVPFAAESALSGVKRAITPEERLHYRRSFTIPGAWAGQRVLLHFGAVDWHAVVAVNGKQIGEHKGGYTPFTFDITDALKPGAGQQLTVSVWDPTDSYTQPRGKQIRNPEGIWYTSVTGIWQTVWLEPVPEVSITRLLPVPDIDKRQLALTVSVRGNAAGATVRAEAIENGKVISKAEGSPEKPLSLAVPSMKLWSPESPALYDLRVSLWRGGKKMDEAASYFGMRKISLGKDEKGFTRLLLNGRPYFQMGPLDQGWWPDGLYTAPTDAALRYDIELTRQLGFNMARKHVKVEPARWYYHCDKLGLMVWQDMPNGSLHRGVANSLRVEPWGPDANRDPQSAAQFEAELKEMIREFAQFPSIVMWVPFNEGWGQYDTARIAKLVKELDPSRLVNSASGWTDRGAGDVYDAHIYPGPGMEPAEASRATVVGEYGGLGLVVQGHLWMADKNWGYRSFADQSALIEQYSRITKALHGMAGWGLSAAIYTQTTDVEGEVNGLATYDRAVVKLPPQTLSALHAGVMNEKRKAVTISPDSSFAPQTWSYTTETPADGWQQPSFNASGWKQGAGGFGSDEGKRFHPGTAWTSPGIWLRREFSNETAAQALFLTMFHGMTECEVYLNGVKIYEVKEPRAERRHYTHIDVSERLSALKRGKNVLAVRATKTRGLRSVDAGLYVLVP